MSLLPSAPPTSFPWSPHPRGTPMLRRTLTVSAFVALLLLPAALLRADAPKGDKDLDGDWEMVSTVRDGKDVAPPGEGKALLTINGDSVTFKMGDMSHKGTIKVDASKTPKTLDLMPADGPQAGKTLVGIYEVKGDELRV